MQHKNTALCCNRGFTHWATRRRRRENDVLVSICICVTAGLLHVWMTAALYGAAAHGMKNHLMKHSTPLGAIDPQQHAGKLQLSALNWRTQMLTSTGVLKIIRCDHKLGIFWGGWGEILVIKGGNNDYFLIRLTAGIWIHKTKGLYRNT